jgi:HEAT repeat protein
VTEYSNVSELNDCLNHLHDARLAHGSQAIADMEYWQNKLYELARIYWKDLLIIVKETDKLNSNFLSDILWALRDIQSDELVSLFQNILSNNKNWEMRYSAIGALSRLFEVDLVDTFSNALRDPDSSIQFRAVTYLEKFGDTRALLDLNEIIQNKSLQRSCPGLVDSAHRAIKRIEKEKI